jgi:hypothetical protein
MPTKKSKNSVESSESVDASVSESGNEPFYLPETKSCISDSTSDYWSLSVTVNKRLWRSLPFREQAYVNGLISGLQEGLENVLNAKFLGLLEEHASSLVEKSEIPTGEELPIVDPDTGGSNI